MRERRGDLWAELAAEPDGWLVVPTNGTLTATGALVMGAGVAAAAARRWPHLPAFWGAHVAEHGNVPALDAPSRTLSWPTKPAVHTVDGKSHPGWMCQARVNHPSCERVVASLVWNMAPLVVALADRHAVAGPILLPYVGCGLGGLSWTNVGPALGGVLDDRFVAVGRT